MVSGYGTNCALTPRGTAFCWGDGSFGALGNGKFNYNGYVERNPVAVTTTQRFTALAAGAGNLQCASTTDSGTFCWGGDGGSVDPIPQMAGSCGSFYWQRFADGPCTVPTAVTGVSKLAMLATDADASCGLTIAGVAWCWGVGPRGELGDGRAGAAAVAVAAVPVQGSFQFATISVGGVGMVCGTGTDSRGYCWGNNFRGYLGVGDTTIGAAAAPISVAGNLRFRSIVAGGAHVCAITTANEVWCWGSSDYGQLGRDKSLGDAFAPVRVTLPP